MDFSNESYVRLYTRDTTTWLRLGWDGQCVLAMVLRKLDMSGVLDCADMEPWEAAVVHCRAPEAAAKAGMDICIRLGVFEHNGSSIVAPKFREAQEATKSDKLRQKESRERRRLDALSQDVTESHTVESQDVTEDHAGSQPVTPGHAESPIAVRCSTAQGDAGQCVASGPDPDLVPPPPKSDQSLWTASFRRITGRDDFADGCGQHTGTEAEALRVFRKTCKGDHGFFEARLTALMAADTRGFLPQQGLRYWADTAIKTDHTKLKATGAAIVTGTTDYENADTVIR